jgi:hypothetical protein
MISSPEVNLTAPDEAEVDAQVPMDSGTVQTQIHA